MPKLRRRPLAITAAALVACATPGAAQACTTSTTSLDLGEHSSFTLAAAPQAGSGSAGLECDILLAVLGVHYIGFQVDASTFLLTGRAAARFPMSPR